LHFLSWGSAFVHEAGPVGEVLEVNVLSESLLSALMGGVVAVLVVVLKDLASPFFLHRAKKEQDHEFRIRSLEKEHELLRVLFWRLNEVTGISVAIVERYLILASDADGKTAENLRRLKVQYDEIVADYERLFGSPRDG
jgi:hypothetical protein